TGEGCAVLVLSTHRLVVLLADLLALLEGCVALKNELLGDRVDEVLGVLGLEKTIERENRVFTSHTLVTSVDSIDGRADLRGAAIVDAHPRRPAQTSRRIGASWAYGPVPSPGR